MKGYKIDEKEFEKFCDEHEEELWEIIRDAYYEMEKQKNERDSGTSSS